MSERLTPHWTRTLEEVYGSYGLKGRYGEVLVRNVLSENAIPARDFEENKQQQVSGVDIETKSHTLDVKANLQDSVFFIEVDAAGWLFNPVKISDLIVHIDVASQECVWYTRSDAKSKIRVGAQNQLLKITPHNYRPDFMSKSWPDLFAYLRVDG